MGSRASSSRIAKACDLCGEPRVSQFCRTCNHQFCERCVVRHGQDAGSSSSDNRTHQRGSSSDRGQGAGSSSSSNRTRDRGSSSLSGSEATRIPTAPTHGYRNAATEAVQALFGQEMDKAAQASRAYWDPGSLPRDALQGFARATSSVACGAFDLVAQPIQAIQDANNPAVTEQNGSWLPTPMQTLTVAGGVASGIGCVLCGIGGALVHVGVGAGRQREINRRTNVIEEKRRFLQLGYTHDDWSDLYDDYDDYDD